MPWLEDHAVGGFFPHPLPPSAPERGLAVDRIECLLQA